LNGANAAIIVRFCSELPAYQGFSAACTVVATSGRSTASMVDLRAPAKLKKMLAGHGVSGVS
jgi:hypothetical protein